MTEPGIRDSDLRAALREAAPHGEPVPDFAASIAAAERKLRRQRQQRFAAAAALAASVALLALLLPNPVNVPDGNAVFTADLLESTAWQAPSDVLLPRHEIDLYQELPVLMESTEPVEGALL